jgi:peptidoglycan/LPS O-acetylase OafA/YrhL
MSTVGFTWLALTYSCLLLLAVHHWQYLFSFRALTFVGGLAYGLYLFHLNVLGLVLGGANLSDARHAALTAAAFCLTVTLAFLSWVYFEKPLVARGHRFRYDDSLFSDQRPIRSVVPN